MKTEEIVSKAPNWLFIPLLLISFFVLSYCTGNDKEQSRKSLDEFKTYVKEHKESVDNYMDRKWDDMEREYNEKKAELDKREAKMDREMKASYNNAVAEWESFKADYTARKSESSARINANVLKVSLLPNDIETDLSNITGQNIVIVYQHFFNTVENNKDLYTKEEWIIINDYWKSLNEIEDRLDENKAITKADHRTIGNIKLKYTATKALNKPFAESATQ